MGLSLLGAMYCFDNSGAFYQEVVHTHIQCFVYNLRFHRPYENPAIGPLVGLQVNNP